MAEGKPSDDRVDMRGEQPKLREIFQAQRISDAGGKDTRLLSNLKGGRPGGVGRSGNSGVQLKMRPGRTNRRCRSGRSAMRVARTRAGAVDDVDRTLDRGPQSGNLEF